MIEARNVQQRAIFDAAPAYLLRAFCLLEAAHAVQAMMQEALACRESGESKTIVFNMSGHGHFDLSALDAYLRGDLVDYEYPEEAIRESLTHLPKVD